MYLTPYQEKILNGEYGWIYAKALELIVKIGEVLGAEKLISVNHVHVSGVSYSNIGDYGLEFIKEFYVKGGLAKVYTTVNPGCIDLSNSSRLISNMFYNKQLEINNYLEKMGFKPTYTCIPYLHRRPVLNEHLAWGESSAVIFANSIYGARTNREGGPLTIASALTGYTYYHGLHLDRERVIDTVISIENIESKYYGLIGLWIGENIVNKPLIKNAVNDYSSLKILLASAAASGDHGLIAIDKITPKKSYYMSDKIEKINIELKDIEKYQSKTLEFDLKDSKIIGFIGCPHLDPVEFTEIYDYIVNIYSRGRCRLRNYLLISVPYIYNELFINEINVLRRIGVEVTLGTCPIVSTISEKPDYVITNSGKAYFYLKKHKNIEVYLSTPFEIIRQLCE
ncbi:MAG: aconitase X catalytic domain-containing protein [Desulfurococcaceae archaeon]